MATCDRCSEEYAIVTCQKCSFGFCQACDAEVHTLPRMKDHVRDPLDNVPEGKPGGEETEDVTSQFSSFDISTPPQTKPFQSPPPQAKPFQSPPLQTKPFQSPPPQTKPFQSPPPTPQRFIPQGGQNGIPPPPPDEMEIPGPPPDGPNAPPITTSYVPSRPQPPTPGARSPPTALRASQQGNIEVPRPGSVEFSRPSQGNIEIPRPGQGSVEIPRPGQQQGNAQPKKFVLPPSPQSSPQSPPQSPQTVRTSNFEIPPPPNAKPSTIQEPQLTPSGGAPKNFRLVLVGTGGVGKSAATIRFTQGTFTEDESDPTIEDSYKKNWTTDGNNYTLDILDTAGQEEYSFTNMDMRTGHGFLLVYAINSRATWNEITDLRNSILRAKDLEQVPIVLVGNKCDLENDRKVSVEEGRQLAEKWGCGFIEASAKGNINVPEMFNAIIREILKAPPPDPNSPDDGKKKATKKFSVKNLFSGGKKK